MRFFSIIFAAALFAFANWASAQGFINLDFECADVSGYSPVSGVPTSSALPGWTAFFANASGTNVTSQVVYDGLSLGGAVISIVDTNARIGPRVLPIQGNYSVALFGGGFGTNLYSAGISQTGLVPAGTRSLLLDAGVYFAPLVVTLGGQTIDMTPLETFANYTLYGGNIPSDLAGQSETLSLIEPPPTGVPPSYSVLDNIQFLSSPIPEPNAFALIALGSLSLGFWRWRKSAQ
jgi:hypothetical protein